MWCSVALLDFLLKNILLNAEDNLFLLVNPLLFDTTKLSWLHDDVLWLIVGVCNGS